jgi:hypothetical protein
MICPLTDNMFLGIKIQLQLPKPESVMPLFCSNYILETLKQEQLRDALHLMDVPLHWIKLFAKAAIPSLNGLSMEEPLIAESFNSLLSEFFKSSRGKDPRFIRKPL